MGITSVRALPGCRPVPMLLAALMFRLGDIGDDATQHFLFRNLVGSEPWLALYTEGAPATRPLALPLQQARFLSRAIYIRQHQVAVPAQRPPGGASYGELGSQAKTAVSPYP